MKSLKLFAIIFSVSALACGCGLRTEKRESIPQPTEVLVAKPVVRDVKSVSSHSARICGEEVVEVRARVGGYLDSVKFKKGQRVKKNQPLFSIDGRQFAIARAAAEATLKAAESKLALAADNERRASVLRAKNAVSEELYQTRNADYLISKAKVLEARANLENARLNCEFANVVAPVSGRIGESLVDCGNLVGAHTTKLATIVRDDVVRVYFDISEYDAVRYRKLGILDAVERGEGAEVEVVQNGDDKIKRGRISYFDNQIGAASSTLKMRADIDNRDGALMAGAFATVSVLEGVRKNALLVPDSAVGTDLATRYVFTVGADGTVKYVPVKVGGLFGGLREIESGISSSDLIIVSGLQRAKAGKKVSPKTVEIK